MMDNLKIDGLDFEILISSNKILKRIKLLAEEIKKKYPNNWPLCLVVLNGASVFANALFTHMDESVPMSLIKVHSYSGQESTNNVIVDYLPYEIVKNRDILLIEDIVDTGLTLNFLKKELKKYGAKNVECVTLFFKPSKYNYPIDPNYVGFSIGDEFIVGYGMDYNQKGRDLSHVYKNVIHQN
ncbi:MAG: hypoxanthine phosphoribosyltransferase [Flavobacteriales bacterium]|nr:hypoxanthine phosphoribosyltransferase [Flavobacteriales bacterium]